MTAGAVGTRVAASATGSEHSHQPASSSTPSLALSSYREYDRSVCLQMVGRAGRPQFDTEGVAVIMTQTEVRGCWAGRSRFPLRPPTRDVLCLRRRSCTKGIVDITSRHRQVVLDLRLLPRPT